MPKTSIKVTNALSSNSAIELLSWPTTTELQTPPRKNEVTAFQTTCFSPKAYVSESLDTRPSETNVSELNASESSAEKTILRNEISTSDSFTINSCSNHSGAYGGFNLALHVNDNIESVSKNRFFLKQYIKDKLATNINIQWLEQIHGNKVIEITHYTKQAVIADASITRKKNIALAIMTADCLPILLCNKQGTEIAAIHGGWRPLAANIIKNTLAQMNSEIDELQVWLGPCIGKTHFEVGEEVKLAFTQQNLHFSKAFILQDNGKYLADLHLIAKQQLADLGVTKISSLAECTFHSSDKYYSYRRESITGRMASIICLS